MGVQRRKLSGSCKINNSEGKEGSDEQSPRGDRMEWRVVEELW